MEPRINTGVHDAAQVVSHFINTAQTTNVTANMYLSAGTFYQSADSSSSSGVAITVDIKRDSVTNQIRVRYLADSSL